MASTIADISTNVQIELGEIKDSLTQEEITRAINKAIIELGYSFPVAGLKEYWLINRSKRHCVEILLLGESENFQFNKLHLQQAFEHLKSLITYYDKEFLQAQETQPELFPNLTADLPNPADMFGVYIGNGFVYSPTGKDITYLEEDN
jgi:hypothetical protein